MPPDHFDGVFQCSSVTDLPASDIDECVLALDRQMVQMSRSRGEVGLQFEAGKTYRVRVEEVRETP